MFQFSLQKYYFFLKYARECIFLKTFRMMTIVPKLLQVDCGLRDHFATTVAYLWASCALSVAVVCQMFMPLYIIVVLNLRRFSVFAPKIGDFERKIGANDMRKWLYYNHFCMGVFF